MDQLPPGLGGQSGCTRASAWVLLNDSASLLCSLFAVAFFAAALVISAFGSSGAWAGVADRNWQRYTDTNGLSLLTDLKDADARSLLQELARFEPLVDEYIAPFAELARSIAPELQGPRVDAVGKNDLELLVMRRRRDFVRLFKPRHFAAFTLPTLNNTVLAVGPVHSKASLREHLLHEYVHYRLRRDVPGGLPLWFEEGLATFLSQVKFKVLRLPKDSDPATEPAQVEFELGLWQSSSDGKLADFKQLPVAIARRNFRGMSSEEVRSFYRSSHGLVRYLYLDAQVDRTQLAASLVLGTPSFPTGVGVKIVDASRALFSLFKGKFAPLYRGSMKDPVLPQLTVDAMTPAYVRRSLAEVAAHVNPAASLQLFAELAPESPDAAWPWLGQAFALRMQQDNAAAAKVLAKAQTLTPQSAPVLVEQAALATAGCLAGRGQHCPAAWRAAILDLRDALDKDPNNFDAVYRLGISHLYLGQPGEALGYLQIAWQRVPWSPRVNYFMGEALRLVGDTRARWYLSNASRWASSDYFQRAAEAALAAVPGTG